MAWRILHLNSATTHPINIQIDDGVGVGSDEAAIRGWLCGSGCEESPIEHPYTGLMLQSRRGRVALEGGVAREITLDLGRSK